MLMYPSHKIKIIQLFVNSNEVYSKVSDVPVPNLDLYDNRDPELYGILFHEEQFVFGTTYYIY